MDLNSRNTRINQKYAAEINQMYAARINQMYAVLHEIDSYKYNLHSGTVLMIQSSILVFLKEKCVSENFTLLRIECEYKSYLLKGAWSQVMEFCSDSEEKKQLYFNTYRRIEKLGPTGSECEAVLDALIDNQSRISHEETNPSEALAELALKLLDYKGGVVYNPNAGYGTFGRLLDIGDDYFGSTFSVTAWSVGIAKMILQDKLPSRNYVCSLVHHLEACNPLEVCNYDRYINIFRPKEFDFDEVFSRLSPEGQAIIILPPGDLIGSRRKEKEKLIQNNLLDTVIFLPPAMIKATNISTALLICKSGRKENAPVIMLDARDEDYTERGITGKNKTLNVNKLVNDLNNPNIDNRIEVSLEAIINENYNLNPAFYLRPIEPLPEGYEVATLKDLTRPAGFVFRQYLPEEAYVINSSSLTLNLTEFRIDTSLLSKTKNNADGFLLSDSCVIIAPRNRHISVAYYKYSDGEQIYADEFLMTLLVDEERIDPEYLVLQLRSTELNTGTSSVSRSYVLNTPIAYPPLTEQRRIVEDTVKANKLTKIRELGLTEEIQRLKDEYKTVIRTKKHNLGTLREKISANVRELLKQANRSSQSGEINIQVLLRRVNRLVDYWSDLDARLDKIADENIFRDPEEFEFDGYFRDLEAEKVDRNYGISYILDKGTFEEHSAKMAINVNPNDFKQVVENIISNAQEHGFRDLQRDDYYLNIRAYCDEDTNGVQRVCFLFENNGYPAPTMTKEQFGTPGWHSDVKGSKGEGLGGAYISEMTRNFGGGYEPPHSIADEIGEYSRTTILIYFPAIIRFNDNELALRQYALETICDSVEEYINYNGYDHNVGFEINFDPELEISAARLQDLGYDMNDDESTYFDESGRPFHSDSSTRHVHWIGDLSVLDKTGKRVANEVYIRAIVEELLSGDKILFI